MKNVWNAKWLLTLLLVAGIGMSALAQDDETLENNSKPAKTMKMIERGYMKDKSDAKALELIQATQMAKRDRDRYVKEAPGYGAAAVDADQLRKFRQKLRKSDPKFQELNKAHQTARREKREYIATVNEEYKQAFDELKANRAETKDARKKTRKSAR